VQEGATGKKKFLVQDARCQHGWKREQFLSTMVTGENQLRVGLVRYLASPNLRPRSMAPGDQFFTICWALY
jgi:hypothetical protein